MTQPTRAHRPAKSVVRPQDPTHMICHLCSYEWEVSEEDADATQSDVIHHLGYRHQLYGQAAMKALMQVRAEVRTS